MRLLLSACVLVSAAVPAFAATGYHVGNSLTWDSLAGATNTHEWVQRISQASDDPITGIGQHIRANSTLTTIINKPSETAIGIDTATYGKFSTGLSGHAWSYVTLQTFNDGVQTLKQEETSMMTLINLTLQNSANSDTRFYIYSGWPGPTGWNNYIKPYTYTDASLSAATRDYQTDLFNRIDALTNADVRYIPVAEVVSALRTKIIAGEIPGLTSINDLYRDTIHFNTPGKWIASLTVASIASNIDPRLVDPNDTLLVNSLSEASWDIIQQTVYDVISSDTRTGFSIAQTPEPSLLMLGLPAMLLLRRRR